MLDVAANNLANVNTLGFKSSRVTFSELLSETIREASQPTSQTGGINPIQVGSGVSVASIDRMTSQGSLTQTGQSLDMAIEGSGYFVLNDGQSDVYTRVGSFSVDSENYLVDPSTGNRVQRIGYEGVAEGFQNAGDSDVRIPYGQTLPAQATENISFTGNLSAESTTQTRNLLVSGLTYTASGAPVNLSSKLTSLDQVSNLANNDEIHITGTDKNGDTVDTTFTITDAANDTIGDLLAAINTAYTGSTASLENGEIRMQDDVDGYSQTDLNLEYIDAAGDDGAFELPGYFRLQTPGSEGLNNVDIEIFDSQGISHILSASFVRTNDSNVWDMVMRSVTGEITDLNDRRIKGIKFLSDGSFGGMVDSAENKSFKITFSNAPSTVRTVNVDFGTVGDYDGVTLSGGTSTVSASGQDGYASGQLSSISVSAEGILEGLFTNGVRKDIAALKLATFRNPSGLSSAGNNYFAASGNSGDPAPTRGQSGGAGAVRGGSLETSNVESATEFVNLIQAQNGFQANARTISVAHDMLNELARLIR